MATYLFVGGPMDGQILNIEFDMVQPVYLPTIDGQYVHAWMAFGTEKFPFYKFDFMNKEEEREAIKRIVNKIWGSYLSSYEFGDFTDEPK